MDTSYIVFVNSPEWDTALRNCTYFGLFCSSLYQGLLDCALRHRKGGVGFWTGVSLPRVAGSDGDGVMQKGVSLGSIPQGMEGEEGEGVMLRLWKFLRRKNSICFTLETNSHPFCHPPYSPPPPPPTIPLRKWNECKFNCNEPKDYLGVGIGEVLCKLPCKQLWKCTSPSTDNTLAIVLQAPHPSQCTHPPQGSVERGHVTNPYIRSLISVDTKRHRHAAEPPITAFPKVSPFITAPVSPLLSIQYKMEVDHQGVCRPSKSFACILQAEGCPSKGQKVS